MRKVYILLYIIISVILLSSSVSAKILNTKIQIETYPEDNKAKLKIEGGSEITFKCSDEKDDTLMLTRDITDECTEQTEECANNLNRLAEIFEGFSSTYNSTISEFDTLIDLQNKANRCQANFSLFMEDYNKLKSTENDTDDLKESLADVRARLSACQSSSSSSCQSDLDDAQRDKWLYFGLGVIVGAIGFYFYRKPRNPRIPGQMTTPR